MRFRINLSESDLYILLAGLACLVSSHVPPRESRAASRLLARLHRVKPLRNDGR